MSHVAVMEGRREAGREGGVGGGREGDGGETYFFFFKCPRTEIRMNHGAFA